MNIKLSLIATLVLPATLTVAEVFTTDTTIGPANTNYDGLSIIVSNCTLTLGGAHRFQSLQVAGSGQVTTDSTYGVADRRVQLTILGDVLVDTNAAINVSAKGYESATGPGAVPGGGGGGHGGHGGTAVSGLVGGGAYGSLLTPTDLGSGGGNGYNAAGGWGGGALQLTVGGMLTVNGSLLANGGNGGYYLGGTAGGGSGGSIYVVAGTLAGNGVISANGGASTGGGGAGGAGGRIAFYYTDSTFSGSWSASGGSAAEYGSGGAGTIFTKAASQSGDLLVDNANAPRATHTPISSPLPCNLTIANGAMGYPTSALTNGNLTVKTNSLLTTLPGQAALNLTILSHAVIEAGGRVDVTGSGYAATNGPGAGLNNGGGGGHGGEGGRASALDAGGEAYDSFLAPAEFGSGGGNAYASTGGAGGGLIRLVVGQTLQVDGVLAANGANAVAGGGGGGGLHLTVGALTGQGVIIANGGSSSGGGGGGGRIAIYSDTRTFSGSLSALPGTGPGQAGGAGTVYLQLNSQTVGDLLVDSGGTTGAFTPLSSPVACHVTLSNRARAYPLAALNFSSLHLATNTLLTHLAGQSNLHLTVQGELVADAGSAIRATGQGYGAVTGPGAGTNSSGGGHGGAGGSVFQGGAGGGTYGSPLTPTALGSGGGNGFNSTGGAGGGAIRLIVGGRLELNGELSADGLNGAGNSGGGGAGGSIWVTADTLAGAGMISALGGGSVWGGGGGGGRIALYAPVRAAFTGLATATSGTAVFPGYPGLNGTVISQSVLPPEISATQQGSTLLLTWPSVTNVSYQLQTATNLPAASWFDEGAPFAGTGGVLTTNLPLGPEPEKFFRLKAGN